MYTVKCIVMDLGLVVLLIELGGHISIGRGLKLDIPISECYFKSTVIYFLNSKYSTVIIKVVVVVIVIIQTPLCG